jgi:hypothetical protein
MDDVTRELMLDLVAKGDTELATVVVPGSASGEPRAQGPDLHEPLTGEAVVTARDQPRPSGRGNLSRSHTALPRVESWKPRRSRAVDEMGSVCELRTGFRLGLTRPRRHARSSRPTSAAPAFLKTSPRRWVHVAWPEAGYATGSGSRSNGGAHLGRG